MKALFVSGKYNQFVRKSARKKLLVSYNIQFVKHPQKKMF